MKAKTQAVEARNALETLAEALGVTPDALTVTVEHALFGTREITHAELARAWSDEAAKAEPETPKTGDSSPEKTDEQKATLERIAQAKAGDAKADEQADEREGLACPEGCGKAGFESQNAVNGHLANCEARDEGDAGDAGESPATPEGEWASLTESEREALKASGDNEAVKALCDDAADYRDAFGTCPAARANGERCEHGRNGFGATFCIRHENASNPEIHPDALRD